MDLPQRLQAAEGYHQLWNSGTQTMQQMPWLKALDLPLMYLSNRRSNGCACSHLRYDMPTLNYT